MRLTLIAHYASIIMDLPFVVYRTLEACDHGHGAEEQHKPGSGTHVANNNSGRGVQANLVGFLPFDCVLDEGREANTRRDICSRLNRREPHEHVPPLAAAKAIRQAQRRVVVRCEDPHGCPTRALRTAGCFLPCGDRIHQQEHGALP